MSELDELRGYRSPTRDVLERFGARVWSDVSVETSRGHFEGLVLPRSETADELHLSLKLASGYNLGLRHDTIQNIVVRGQRRADYRIPEEQFPKDPGKPRVRLFGTGGTIASRLDYRTGAVIPAFSPGELYGSVPELADYCNLDTEKLFGVFSENMGAEQYRVLATEIGKAIEEGYEGIVVGHGTDTMHHTASVLTYMLQGLPVPVVLVGSQRSSDRPSSDAARNLISAVAAAASGPIAEVTVCMFGPTSDRYQFLHRGTRVRKMHSSVRSTFRTIGDVPLATVEDGVVRPIHKDFERRDPQRRVLVRPHFEERVALLTYYPNMRADVIDGLIDRGYRGIVIAGTGLGHVNRQVYPALERAQEAGVGVFMTLQTLWGYVQMNVYETGREILGLGVIPLANMLPEVAYMKLCWALGTWPDDSERVREEMLRSIGGDMTEREPIEGYLVLQGGVPEVDQFLREHWV